MGRVDPLPPGEWPPEMADALAALRPPNPRYPFPSRDPSRPKGLNALGLLAHHPELTTAYHHFNGHVLFASTITPRQRELLVLRVAVLRDADYEWAQHAVLAGDAGITAAELERVRSGPDDAGWSPFEAALLTAADELVRDARLSDAHLGHPVRRTRHPAAHGRRVHRRRLRPAGHGVPHLRRRARRRPA